MTPKSEPLRERSGSDSVPDLIERLRALANHTVVLPQAKLKETCLEAADALTYQRGEISMRDDIIALTNKVLEEKEAEIERLKAELLSIRNVIPMDFLRAHDEPGATGPTENLDLASAVRHMVEHGRKLEADK